MVAETALYERLGVTHDATGDQIRRSYRQAALLWHPDRNRDDPEAADKFKACLEAYEILSNPQQRLLYDTYGFGGVQRTAEAPAQATQSRQAQPSAGNRTARHPRRPDGFFFDEDDFFSFFPQNLHTHAQTQRSSGGGGGQPSGFATSWSFSTSSSYGADGSYTTQYHSWNSRDGHRSGQSSGTFGPDGARMVSSNGSNHGNHGNPPLQQRQQQQQQQSSLYSDSHRHRAARGENCQHPAQNMQSMLNPIHSDLHTDNSNPYELFGHRAGGFGNLFDHMASGFPSLFPDRLFGQPGFNQGSSSNGSQQPNRQYRQR
ncbi:hypothetical protein SEPCBS57363_004057 [Sporothrix epigloea]|uniref:J domain-containing protein n=1 Tax=Sporothrix epigloea TaxID=1892477 RepID=A0ABP0DTN8_9PEZI